MAQRVLLFRTDRLGDLVLALPVVEALRAAMPDAEVDLVCAPRNAPLARLQGNLGTVIENRFTLPRDLFSLVRRLRAGAYDAAVHLYPRPSLALVCFLARIPVRVGTSYRFYSPLFNRRVRVHRKTMCLHEHDLNLRVAEGLGLRLDAQGAGLRVPERARAAVRGLLGSRGIKESGTSWVVLHPGSGGSSERWPARRYGELARMLTGKGIPVVVTGTEADHADVAELRTAAGPGVADLSCELDLVMLAALLERAPLVVTNSTGPLHLADALGTPVLGLYSPHVFDAPARWGPYSQPDHVLVPEGIQCKRCRPESCTEACMASIGVETVLARVLARLGRGRDARGSPIPFSRKQA